MQYVRPPQVAGYFYPADAEKLKKEIKLLLDTSRPEKDIQNIFGIVSPHAGYVYSGKTAAYVYNLIRGKSFKRIIVVSPSHAEYFRGVSVFEGDGYETPLGTIEVDKDFTEKLINGCKIVFKGFEGHKNEHALEVQLPFLQSVLSNFKIVPVVMGDQSKETVDAFAKKLAEVIDKSTRFGR
jgi:AmmeMemoRadiSam system protein B